MNWVNIVNTLLKKRYHYDNITENCNEQIIQMNVKFLNTYNEDLLTHHNQLNYYTYLKFYY